MSREPILHQQPQLLVMPAATSSNGTASTAAVNTAENGMICPAQLLRCPVLSMLGYISQP